jgi:hypothetical protein
MRRLLLFDIDSVLVEPNGYWTGIQHTVGLYAQRLGYPPDVVPSHADIQVFEACGLTSEWDSCPACVAALLIGALAGVSPPPAPDHLVHWLFRPEEPLVSGVTPAPPPPGFFAGLARQVRAVARPGERMSHAAQRALLAYAPGPLWMAVHALLDDTHDIARAPVTQVFQQFALGDARYCECYGREPFIHGPSLLELHDRPLLDVAHRSRLRALLAAGAGACLYTARPSRPPRGSGADPHGFSPEAEIAAALVELDDLPLIGFGEVSWLAAERHQRPDRYLKPSPVQALAAIGAALLGAEGEAQALRAAATLAEEHLLLAPFTALQGDEPTRVIVFEDTERGAHAVLQAVELLNAAGCAVEAQVVAVVAPGGVKAQALAPLSALVVADVNAAIDWLA